MGQGLSCAVTTYECRFFCAVQMGEVELVEAFLRRDSGILHQTTVYDRLSALHIAAANGQIEVDSFLTGKILPFSFLVMMLMSETGPFDDFGSIG